VSGVALHFISCILYLRQVSLGLGKSLSKGVRFLSKKSCGVLHVLLDEFGVQFGHQVLQIFQSKIDIMNLGFKLSDLDNDLWISTEIVEVFWAVLLQWIALILEHVFPL